MTSIQKLFSCIAIVAVLFFAFRYCSKRDGITRSKNNAEVIVGTAAEFPPFEFIKDDAIVGFDIDLITAVVERIGKKITLRDMPFVTLIPQAQRGSIHIIASGITPTAEREKEILFTKPYLISDPLVVVTLAKNPITCLDDLQGKTVIVNEGFTAERYMAEKSGIDLKRLPTVADAFLSLTSGRAFAFVVAANNVKPFFKQYSAQDFSVYTIPNTNEATAFGVSKKYPELLHDVQKALDALQEEGFIDGLKKKWDLA